MVSLADKDTLSDDAFTTASHASPPESISLMASINPIGADSMAVQ